MVRLWVFEMWLFVPGSSKSSSSTTGTGASRELPSTGPLGSESGVVSGHLPLCTAAPSVNCQGAAASAGVLVG